MTWTMIEDLHAEMQWANLSGIYTDTDQKGSESEVLQERRKQAFSKEKEKKKLHIFPHGPDLIRRMHHDSLLIRLDPEILFIHDMLHTRRIISTHIMTGYQRFILRPSALQHLNEIRQVTRCIAAPARRFRKCGVGGVGVMRARGMLMVGVRSRGRSVAAPGFAP